MPSRPLSADRSAVVKLLTRLDNEATDVAKARTEIPAAVARLVQLVPPARLDLVDEVPVRVGRRDLNPTLDWPPVRLVHQLAYRVKRVHLGEIRLRGESGEVVDLVTYVDKMQQTRRVNRLTRHGVFIGEYKTVEELAKHVNLATLVEDVDGSDQPASPANGDGPR
jgi:hypothetical protein